MLLAGDTSVTSMPREAHTHLAEWAALLGADLPDSVLGEECEDGRATDR